MQVIHTALNYTVNTRTTAIASSGRHLCNRDTCPDCSHLSVAAVRLMESVRERLVASWNKAVASAVSTSQHPKPSVTLTSMPAIPVTSAVVVSLGGLPRRHLLLSQVSVLLSSREHWNRRDWRVSLTKRLPASQLP